jgi:hypothetical protein
MQFKGVRMKPYVAAQDFLLSSADDRVLPESASGDWGGSGDRSFVTPFHYALAVERSPREEFELRATVGIFLPACFSASHS